MDSEFADKLAHECISHYNNLGKKGKPLMKEEWTMLSCFALSTSGDSSGSTVRVVAAATGTKCLGYSQMQPGGSLVNDSHAEVLARRSLLRYIYDQISIFKSIGSSEIIIGLDERNRFKIDPQVKFHFFSSHVPCGDASIIPKLSNHGNKRKSSLFKAGEQEPLCKKIKEMDNSFDRFENGAYEGSKTMFESVGQEVEMDIHRTGAKSIGKSDGRLSGAMYHMVGVVRTKPGRGDQTLSVSCSDKLARWLRCGMQGALLSLLLSQPVMLSSIVIGHGGPFSKEVLRRAVTRANPPNTPLLLSSQVVFPHSRYELSTAVRPCPSALVWAKVRHKPVEVCVEGRRQGCTKKSRDCGRLLICKLELLRTFTAITESKFFSKTYRELKISAESYQAEWRQAKNDLGTWTSKPIHLEEFRLPSDKENS